MSGKRDHLPVESGTVWSSGHVCNAMKASNWKLVRFSKATDKFRRRKRSAYLSLSLSLLALSARCLDGRIKFFALPFNVLSPVAKGTVQLSCHWKCAKRMGGNIVDMPALPQICLRSTKLRRESRKYALGVRVPDKRRIY
jgi:hypothetical protein